MVKRIESSITVELIESDDAMHRYVLHKLWDDQKPCCTIITLYPGSAELVVLDTTQMLMTNNLHSRGYGGYYSVNLFSKLGLSERDRREISNATDRENDKAILTCAKKSSEIIFAWGSLPNTNAMVKKRVDELLSKLHTQLHKCYYLTNAEGENYYHPLATSVRYDWNLLKCNVDIDDVT